MLSHRVWLLKIKFLNIYVVGKATNLEKVLRFRALEKACMIRNFR